MKLTSGPSGDLLATGSGSGDSLIAQCYEEALLSETLLTLHILAAAAWIGGALLLGFVGPRMGKAGGPAAGAWVGVVLEAIPRFFVPAALLTLASGIAIVSTQDEWDWSDPFVGIGTTVVAVALAIALFNNTPALKAMLAAARAGDMPTLAANARKVTRGGSAIALLLMGTEAVMVLRLGAG
ncbi:MAG: hypothetical protein OEM39_01825 [Acidimicrobiia bacterium]|nr:hypothetical protein [Acidimicrobiia bacterium]MDH3463049.1 hypothetical protein [Acidimicrobiia bacterium]